MTDVTDADREAAAMLVAWHNKVASEWKTNDGSDLQFFTSGMPAQIRLGAWDNHDVVQAFARHREASIAPYVEALRAIKAEAKCATSSDGKERDPWAIGRVLKIAENALLTDTKGEG